MLFKKRCQLLCFIFKCFINLTFHLIEWIISSFVFINLRSGGDPKQIWYIPHLGNIFIFLTARKEIHEVFNIFYSHFVQ